MSDTDAYELAWTAFMLGAQISHETLGAPFEGEFIEHVFALLCEISKGEATLHDPTELARGSEEAATLIALGHRFIHREKEVACIALAGLDSITLSEEEQSGFGSE